MALVKWLENPSLKRALLLLGCAILAMVLAFIIQTKFFFLLIGFGAFCLFIAVLYLKFYELFILFVLAANEQFFSLLPKAPLGRYTYQSLLYVILPVAAGLALFKAGEAERPRFRTPVVFLFFLSLMGVMNSFAHGQPLVLSLKAGIGYYWILYYFIFHSKKIDPRVLSDLIIAFGVGLAALNNVQYVFFGKLKIFDYSVEMERIGRLRFLIPEMFILFSAIVALASYLFYRKKAHLIAFIYVTATIVIQGQTRIHIWGLTVATVGLLVFAKKATLLKTVSLGIPLLVLLIWALPLFQNSVLTKLFELTRHEMTSSEGNIAVRVRTYDYYMHETLKSPLIGRGIWNDLFDVYMGDNPEDMKYKDLHLSDVGIMSLIFHFGLLGILWLVWLFTDVAKALASSLKKPRSAILYACVGYFLFSLAVLPTLNCLTRYDSIIYLALFLALLGQNLSPDAFGALPGMEISAPGETTDGEKQEATIPEA